MIKHLSGIFFMLMIWIPTSFVAFRFYFFLYLFFELLKYCFFAAKWKVRKNIFYFYFLSIFAGLFFCIYGVLNKNPGAIQMVTVSVIWPLFYFLLGGIGISSSTFKIIFKYFRMGYFLATLTASLFIVNGIYETSYLTWVLQYLGSGLGQVETQYMLHYFGMPTIFFGFIFFSFYSLEKNCIKIIDLFFLILAFVVILISGRRAFWGGCLFALLAYCFCFNWKRNIIKILKIFLYPTTILTFLFFLVVFNIEIKKLCLSLYHRFLLLFDAEDFSISRRVDQIKNLCNGIKDKPFFGHGFGGIPIGEEAWQQETVYLAKIYAVGISGTIIYLICFFYMLKCFWQLTKKEKTSQGFLVPILVSVLSFCFINATNPYLEKFDYIWIYFLPILLVSIFYNSPKLSLKNLD